MRFIEKCKELAAASALLLLPACAVRAAEAPGKKWTETAQVTFLSANGNSKSSTLGANELFKYDWQKASLELTADALGSSQEGVVTAEQYSAAEKVSRKLSDRNYVFERVGWDKNRFSGIANRIDTSVGLGRELLKTDKDLLAAELGGGYVNEQRVKSPRVDFGSGRAYMKYTRTLSATASFSQDAEYLHSFSDQDDYRLNTQTSLVASLTTHFSLKTSYVWKKVNLPPPGFGRNDTLTSAALIFNY
jgi:putative salt-induced outer membrane protein YdiY